MRQLKWTECSANNYLSVSRKLNLTPSISVFSPNTGKYRPAITPYLDTFHAVKDKGRNMIVDPV